ncbi:hypothetical protein [Motilibacter aurantiacus]|uniref:hypothetical protein n=1 Tax=Motilibacter aurantiacus TaxID=2714955 RepID=UPI0014078C84|nr:hypothetical protein [Motilibacter aurantiacus]NHC44158.1 hypothetical protein [Motilibacter aurantiacus]
MRELPVGRARLRAPGLPWLLAGVVVVPTCALLSLVAIVLPRGQVVGSPGKICTLSPPEGAPGAPHRAVDVERVWWPLGMRRRYENDAGNVVGAGPTSWDMTVLLALAAGAAGVRALVAAALLTKRAVIGRSA